MLQSVSLVQYRWREDKNKIWSVSSRGGNVKSLGSWLYAWPNILLALVWLFLPTSQPDKPLCQETVMLHHYIHMFLMVVEKTISGFWASFPSSHDSMNCSFEMKSIMNILYFTHFKGLELCKSQQGHFFTGKRTEIIKCIPIPTIKNDNHHTCAGRIICTRWATHHYVILDAILKAFQLRNTDLCLIS